MRFLVLAAVARGDLAAVALAALALALAAAAGGGGEHEAAAATVVGLVELAAAVVVLSFFKKAKQRVLVGILGLSRFGGGCRNRELLVD